MGSLLGIFWTFFFELIGNCSSCCHLKYFKMNETILRQRKLIMWHYSIKLSNRSSFLYVICRSSFFLHTGFYYSNCNIQECSAMRCCILCDNFNRLHSMQLPWHLFFWISFIEKLKKKLYLIFCCCCCIGHSNLMLARMQRNAFLLVFNARTKYTSKHTRQTHNTWSKINNIPIIL